tara:strand:- start:2366 stop:2587 length:222 start_codon:yes stop_codon:yes gene_type:complete
MNILPPYIIEQIRRYEEERRRIEEQDRPRVWIPVPDLPPIPYDCPEKDIEKEDDNARGVIIIDIDSYEENNEE